MSASSIPIKEFPQTDSLYHSLGPACDDQDTVKAALTSLFVTSFKLYSDFLDEVREHLKNNPDYLSHRMGLSKDITNLHTREGLQIIIPLSGDKSLPTEARYWVNFFFNKIDSRSKTNPFEEFLATVNQKIKSHGFDCSRAEVRLEIGYFNSLAPDWHLDDPAPHPSITLCYSNRHDWITRVVRTSYALKTLDLVDEDIHHCIPDDIENASAEQLDVLEGLSVLARFGYLYDAQKVVHRSPTLEDLNPPELSKRHWRVFIKFG